jgi:hypothetical protein
VLHRSWLVQYSQRHGMRQGTMAGKLVTQQCARAAPQLRHDACACVSTIGDVAAAVALCSSAALRLQDVCTENTALASTLATARAAAC